MSLDFPDASKKGGNLAAEPDEQDHKANLFWIRGDLINLCCVAPGTDKVNDESAYEYFAGHDEKGKPVWSSDFKDLRPAH